MAESEDLGFCAGLGWVDQTKRPDRVKITVLTQSWCRVCRRLWKNDGMAASDTVYHGEPCDPPQTTYQLICEPCRPKVYALS